MGLFDKLKQQGMDFLQQSTETLNNLNGDQQPTVSQEHEQSDSNTYRQQSSSPKFHIPSTLSTPPPPQTTSAASIPAQDQNGGLYGDYIERLIDMALADGELTEKEKQVLFKKAESMGIDLDEFEMVLDARLYEKQKSMSVSQPSVQGSAPKSNKLGDVRKCPSCGAILETFTTRCPDCGHELNGIGIVSSFNALISKLEEYDKKESSNQIINMLSGGEQRRIQRKKQIISNFPIPTSREDLLEFLSMGLPLSKKKGSIFTRNSWASEDYEHNQLASAWKAKLEQVLMKARIAMKDDKATLAEIEMYAKELNK